MHCSSPPTAPTNNLPSDFFNRMKESLIKGRDSAILLRRLLTNGGGGGGESSNKYTEEAELADKVFASFRHGISLLEDVNHESDELDRSKDMIINNSGGGGLIKTEDDSGESPKNVAKDGRGCHKRRKTCESWEKISETLLDDGHGWRKYGQKKILGTNHRRNYYRCTHKPDRGCPATKQVQKVSDNPERYRTLYIGHHTCNTGNPFLQTIQTTVHDNDEDVKNMLCFGTNPGPTAPPSYCNNSTPTLNYKNLPPQKTSTTASTPPPAALSFSSPEFLFATIGTSCTDDTMMIKQEHCSPPSIYGQVVDSTTMTMDMISNNHNKYLMNTELMYSSSPSDNCNFSSIDHPTTMNNSTGPDQSATGSDHGDAVSVGNCPASPSFDSLECFDIDSYMKVGYHDHKLDDVLGFRFSLG